MHRGLARILHSLRLAPRPSILAILALLALALGLAAAAANGAPALSIVSGPDGPTRDTTPSFGFEADPGATLECSIDQGAEDWGACDSDGTHAVPAPLPDGSYTFRVRATDSIPEQTVATRSFTVDTTLPALSIDSGPSGPVADAAPTFAFTAEAGTTVECSVDQATPSWGPCSGAQAHTPAALADGGYTFRVRATDAAGNVTVRTRAFTVDTVAPSATISGGPANVGNDATPTFTFAANEGGVAFQCRLDGPTFTACTSPRAYGTLAEGEHEFAVRATDAAGNVGAEDVATFTIDLTNPTLAILSGPAGATDDDAPEFGFEAENGTDVECSVDQGTPSWGPCSGAAAHSPATLVDGAYTFRVRATDTAANVTTRTRGFTVDTIDPEVTIYSTPLGTTDDQTPTFEFSSNESGVSFECRLDGPTFTACGSPRSYGPLAAGAHTFAVRATDAAGNVSAEDVEPFTIDLTNPTLAIVSGPEGPTNDDSPQFGFEAENGTDVECSIDAGTPDWGPCDDNDSHAAGALDDGSYRFHVRATDGAGHTTVQERAFTVDTIAPETTFAGGPAGPTNNPSPVFTLGSNEAGVSFECGLDTVTLTPCQSPKAYSSLAQGTHTLSARATDAAGNVDATVVTRGFVVDTVVPTVSIGFGPSGTTADDSPLFEFAATGADTIECSVDQGTPSYGPCSSAKAHVVTSRLANGVYTFRVRVSDLAGNASTATRSFTVATGATTPPTTPPTNPGPPTVATTPRLMSPFPLVRLSGRLTGSGAKVQILTVRAPRGSRVQVRVQPRCAKDARCKPRSGSGTTAANGILRFKRLELAYRAGTTIEVRVSRAGLIGKYTRFVIRRGKAPQRLDRCLMPGATRGSACPSA